MRFLAGLKTHSRRPVYTPPGSAQHTMPKLVVSRRALALKRARNEFSFFGSRKSADLLPRATRGYAPWTPRSDRLSVPTLCLPLSRDPCRTAWSTPVRRTRCAKPWSSSTCLPAAPDPIALDLRTGGVGPGRARCGDRPGRTSSRSMCGTGRIGPGRAQYAGPAAPDLVDGIRATRGVHSALACGRRGAGGRE